MNFLVNTLSVRSNGAFTPNRTRASNSLFTTASDDIDLSDANKFWGKIKSTIRRRATDDDGGFLQLEQYALDVFSNYCDSGHLGKEEFHQAVHDMFGEPLSNSELESIFSIVDKNYSRKGYLTDEEFIGAFLLNDEEIRKVLVAFREAIKKKFGSRDTLLYQLYDYLSSPSGGEFVSSYELHEVIHEYINLEMSEAEILSAMDFMDLDGDGIVSVEDFIGFIGAQGDEIMTADIASSRLSSVIVDVKVSATQLEEEALDKQGYRKMNFDLNEGTFGKPIYIWYRRYKHGGAGIRLKPVTDIIIENRNTDSALVIDGYQCIATSLNSGNMLSTSDIYLWIRRAVTEEEETRDGIIELAITTGKEKDRNNHIHNPPGTGFCRVPGNLKKGTIGKDMLLWYKPIKSRQMSTMPGGASFRLASTLSNDRRQTEMGKNIRRHIRQYVAPSQVSADSAGPIQFSTFFNKFDTRNRGMLTKQQLEKLLREVGLNVEAKDLTELLSRIDSQKSTREISREQFLRFIALTEDEMDETCDIFRRRIKVDFEDRSIIASPYKEQIKILRQKFDKFDSDSDGVLSIQDLCNILESIAIYLTSEELQKLYSSRFDQNGDGKLDLLNFVKFFLSKDNFERRMAARVSHAIDCLRNHFLSMQNENEKVISRDQFDSTTPWNELKRKQILATGKPFKGCLNIDDISMVLEELGIRLSAREVKHVVQRIAPISKGSITQEDIHHFICTATRSNGQLIKVLEKEVLTSLLEKYRCLRHMQHRKSFHTKEKPSRYNFGGTVNVLPGMHGKFIAPDIKRANTLRGTINPTFSKSLKASSTLSPFQQTRFRALKFRDETEKGMSIYNDSDEEEILKCELLQLIAEVELAVSADSLSLTTIDKIHKGIASLYNISIDTISVHEWIQVAQFVGSDCQDTFLVNARVLFEGICTTVMSEETVSDAMVLELVSLANQEAIDIVCDDLINMINDEARQEDGSLDYSKPFKLFDEEGNGTVQVDYFRNLLYRLNIDSALRESQMIDLLNRFDSKRSGFITLQDFEAFAKRTSWGEKSSNDNPVNDLFKTRKVITGQESGPNLKRLVSSKNKDKYKNDQYNGNASIINELVAQLENLYQLKKEVETIKYDLMEELKELKDSRGLLTLQNVAVALKRIGIQLDFSTFSFQEAMKQFIIQGKTTKDSDVAIDEKEFVKAIVRACKAKGKNEQPLSSSRKKIYQKLALLQHDFKCALSNDGWLSLSNKNINEYFNKMSANENGKISSTKFKKLLRQLNIGSYLSTQEVHQVFEVLDENSNGILEYSEFYNFMTNECISYDNVHDDDTDLSSLDSHSDLGFDDLLDQLDTKDKIQDLYKNSMKLFSILAPNEEKRSCLLKYLQEKEQGFSGHVSKKSFMKFLQNCNKKYAQITNDKILSKGDIDQITSHFLCKNEDGIDYQAFFNKVFKGTSAKSASISQKMHGQLNQNSIVKIINDIQEAIVKFTEQGKTYHDLFRLSDISRSGLVQFNTFKNTLHMIGCQIRDDDFLKVLKALPDRSDGMVNYEEFYNLLRKTTPPVHLTSKSPTLKLKKAYDLLWPSTFSTMRNDNSVNICDEETELMNGIASRVREKVLETVQIFGSQFSIEKQFEHYDLYQTGYISLDDFIRVLVHLGVHLSSRQISSLENVLSTQKKSVDYKRFCKIVLCDGVYNQALVKILVSQFSDLRRKGIDVKSAFETFDPYRTCFISRSDFENVMQRLQVVITKHQLLYLLDTFSLVDNPDVINYDEFLCFVKYFVLPQNARSTAPEISHSDNAQCAMKMVTNKMNRSFYDNIQNIEQISSKGCWKCSICMYSDNNANIRLCGICNTPRTEIYSSDMTKICENCTFDNPTSTRECQMCGEPLLPIR